MEIIRKVFTQTSWQVATKVITSLSTIFIISQITRFSNESSLGIYTLTLAYLAFFYLSCEAGINAFLLPRFLAGDILREWKKSLGLRIGLSLLLMVLAQVLTLILPFDSAVKPAILTASFTIPFYALFVNANLLFQSKQRYDLQFLALLLGTAFISIATYWILNLRLGFINVFIFYYLGWVLTSLSALWLLRSYVKSFIPIFSWSFYKEVLTSIWPISLTLVLNTVYFRIDTFMLDFYHGLSVTGIYNLAYIVFQSILVLPNFIMNSFYPFLVRSTPNKNTFWGYLLKSAAIMIGLSFLATLTTWLLAPMIINILASGSGFAGSVATLQILSLSLPAFFLSALLLWSLISLKKFKLVLLIYLLGLIINLGLNFYSIPRFSFIGASWVTLISEYLILVFQIIILWKVRSKL